MDSASSGLRAAFADREAVARLIAIAFGEGRLEVPEFEWRVRAAYAARTEAELGLLLVDLPPPPHHCAGRRRRPLSR